MASLNYKSFQIGARRKNVYILPKLRFISNKGKARFNRPAPQTKSTKLILESKAISDKLDAVQILLSTKIYLLKCQIFLCKLVL